MAEETKTEETKPAEEAAKPEAAKTETAGPKADPAKFADLISQVEKLTVMELAELVKALEEKFGISAAAPAAAGGAAGGAAEEEKTSFNVMLKASGDQKLNVIKAVRAVTELGLKEAKDLVDGAPKMVKEGVKKEEADEMKAKLEEAGATVEIQ